MYEKTENPFHTLLDFLGQEMIDRRNASLYQAIAQNDFQSLQKAVHGVQTFGLWPQNSGLALASARSLHNYIKHGTNPGGPYTSWKIEITESAPIAVYEPNTHMI